HADVHSYETNVRKLDWNGLGNYLLAFDWFVTVDNLVIGGQQKIDSLLCSSLLYLKCDPKHVVFNKRLAHSEAFCLEKRVRHGSSDQDPVDATVDQSIDDGDLVRNLRAAEYRNEWMLGIVEGSS